MPLTPEEKAEIVKEIGTNTSSAIKELADTIIKPLADKVDGLVPNHKALADTLTANQRAEEDSMRGEVIANSLAGDALKEMFKQCGESAPLGANAATDKGGLTADINNLPKE